MIFKSSVALLFSLAIGMSASAAPVVLSSLSERDVWAPKVTSPNAGTTWKIGSSQTVTWYVESAVHPPLPSRYGGGVLIASMLTPTLSFCVIGTRQTPLRRSRTPSGAFCLGI